MKILACESSCDDMSWAIVDDKMNVISCEVFSQNDIHAITGGVVPEIAAREHVYQAIPVLKKLCPKIEDFEEIDYIAVTKGPGLLGSVLVGINTAQTISLFLDKPLIPIHHIEGHIYSNWLERKVDEIKFPIMVLTVSGGHNDLYLIKGFGDYELIGQTLDDASGEAFDKVSRVLELGYPGGPEVEKFINEMKGKYVLDQKDKYIFPRAWGGKGTYNFSFSGLKSEIKRFCDEKQNQNNFTEIEKYKIALGFEESVIEVLGTKLFRASEQFSVKSICVSGGVSANSALKTFVFENADKFGFDINQIFFPVKKIYSTDNAAMIAGAAQILLRYNKASILRSSKDKLDLEPSFSYVL